MAVPKRRKSRSRKKMRRAQWNMKTVELGKCPTCGARVPTHVVCPSCGHYMGRPMIELED